MEMAMEIDYDSTKPEVMELENGDAENVTNNFVDEGKMLSKRADVEGFDCLEEEATNLDKQVELEEDLKKAVILEDTTGETLVLDVIELPQGERGEDLHQRGEDLHQREDLKDAVILEDTTGETLLLDVIELPQGERGEDLHEQGEDLKDAGILEDTTGETLALDVIGFPEGPKRRSSALVIGANHKFPVRSRYLRGSFGSCHDLCKYGHKHPEVEKNTTRPLLRTVREHRPLQRTGSDNMVRVLLNEGIKKKKDGRRLSLPGSSKGVKETPTVNQLKFKRVQSEIKPSLVASPRLRNRNECQTGKKIVARSLSLVENTTLKVKEIKTKPKKESISHEKEKVNEKAKEPMNGSISPQRPLKKSSSIESRLYKNLKVTSHSKKHIVFRETSKVEPTRADMIKSVRKVSKVAPPNEALPSTSRWSQVSKNKESKDSNGLSSSFSPSEPASLPSTKEKPSQPKEDTLKKSEHINPKVARKVKSENGSRPTSPRTKSSVDSRMIPKRRGSLPDEKDASAWKLKFKRGTVVSLQGSNNSPKKLKFKRGKILGDDENSKDGIACELNRNDDTGNEPSDAKSEARKVQLRHQETSGKKDNVDLNNVIEETATKLAKTRKSKVKALVGAFESVMSIGESAMEAGAS